MSLDRAVTDRRLAVAEQLDYRSTDDAYERHNNETRINLSFENLTTLKQEKKTSSSKDRSALHCFSINSSKSNEEISANEAAQKKQRILGLVASMLESSLLLFAKPYR